MDHFRRVVDVNLHGLFLLCQLAFDPMVAAGRGSIVNVASMLGLVGSAPIKQASYCASKGAVVNLTRELACQWARKGVRVNAIAPGWFPSEMTADMWGDEARRRSSAATPRWPARPRRRARRGAAVPRRRRQQLRDRPDHRRRRRLDRPLTGPLTADLAFFEAGTRYDEVRASKKALEQVAGAGLSAASAPNSAATKSVAPACRSRSMPSRTVASSPTIATSAGPAAPSRSSIARYDGSMP